jgi:hypothetical protein
MYKFLIASVAIGVTDIGGIYLLQHFGLLLSSSGLAAWASVGLILWVAAVWFGVYRWGARGLWGLIGLPLVLLPLAAIVVAAGMI